MTRYASPAVGYFASVNQAKKGIESMKHYKNLGKRVLSLFVAFIMCVSLVPGTALAAKAPHNPGEHCELCESGTHDHAYSFPETCTYCKCCGAIYWAVLGWTKEKGTFCGINNKNHIWKDVPPQAATCLTPGHEAGQVCKICSRTTGLTEIHAKKHAAAEVIAWTTDSNKHWKVCPDCQENVLEAAHSYDYTTGKCKDCGYECMHNYEGAKWEHDDAEHPAEGFHWRHCTICNYSSEHVSHQTANEITPVAVNGRLVWTCECGLVIQEVTCLHLEDKYVYMDNEGSATHKITCGDCGETVNEKENHHFVGGKCSFCGAEESASTDCQHPGTWIAKPTADKAKHEYYCGVCGELAMQGYTEDHTYDLETHTCICGVRDPEAGVDPSTCEHKGTRTPESCGDLTHAYRCDDCGQLIPGSLVNHGYKCMDNGDGTHSWLCTVCKAEDPDYDPWQHEAHSWVEENGIEKCGKCGAVKPVDPTPECDHPGTKLSWTDNQDGETHAVFCNGCGTTIDKAAAHTWENDVCKFCRAQKTENPKPDECKHYLNTVPERAPTCTEDGMKKHLKCSKCGKVFEAGAATAPNPVETTVEALTINKLSHDLTTTVVEATCTSKGSETTTCTRCGYSEKKELPMIAHTRKDVAAKAATCLEAGNVEYWTCEVCNKNFTGSGTNSVEITDVTTPALGHDWVEDGKTDSTCSDKGNQHYTCSRCDAVKDEVIDPTGHTPETIAAKTPTCTETGLTEGSKCSVCDAIIEEQETVPALGHDIVTDEAVPATCTGTGLTEGSHCSRCGDAAVAQEVVAALGHDWDNGVVSTAATCDGAGVRTHTCQREGCGETETRAISALGHSAVSYANVAATCTTVGYTGGSYCSRCSAVITARTTVPATGHAWNAGVITTYPTYYSTGLRTYTCATCAATRTETIPQLTYTYDPGYTDPDPDPDPDYQPPVSSNRQPTTTIPDDNTPLGNTPNTPTVTIEDEDTPLANRPLPFIDVASGDWFRPYVSFVYGKGMMTGMSDTLFGPNVSTTRGMIVTIIYRMENASATGVSPFTDVERDEYYADPISWASDNGVVLGYSETLFGPKDNITREQMAAILYRYCVSKGIDVANYGDLSRFPDGDKVSDYAVEAMRWAVDRGLIAGMDDGRLDPTGTATRAQVATILNRFCEMIGA